MDPKRDETTSTRECVRTSNPGTDVSRTSCTRTDKTRKKQGTQDTSGQIVPLVVKTKNPFCRTCRIPFFLTNNK